MKNLHIEQVGQTPAVITISLGVALLLNREAMANRCLSLADAALYRAKGRRSESRGGSWPDCGAEPTDQR